MNPKGNQEEPKNESSKNFKDLIGDVLKQIDNIDDKQLNDNLVINKYDKLKKYFKREQLIECLNVLHQLSENLDIRDLANWLEKELNGYSQIDYNFPDYRCFKARLIHEGVEVPERMPFNLVDWPIDHILIKIQNKENIESIVEHGILDHYFGKYFAGFTMAIIAPTQLIKIKSGIFEIIEKIIKKLREKVNIKNGKIEIDKEFELIEIDFVGYELREYNEFKELINICGADRRLTKTVPILLRTLFENLLKEILNLSISNKQRYIIYEKGRIRDFSKLIAIFNILKDNFFIENYVTQIPQK